MGIATVTRPSRVLPTTVLAVTLGIAGLLLTSVNWWFLLLTAAGAFGPGLLREFGWLRDQDEFERMANYRAGYPSYLAGGIVAIAFLAFVRGHRDVLQEPQEIATILSVVLWCTWLLSSLVRFWGAKTAAYRILMTFGCIWFTFAVLSNTGREWTGWTALLLHPLLSLPFFCLAWYSRRQPRISGLLLIAVAIFFTQFLGLLQATPQNVLTRSLVTLLFVGPLLASGIALVAAGSTASATDLDGTDDDPDGEAEVDD